MAFSFGLFVLFLSVSLAFVSAYENAYSLSLAKRYVQFAGASYCTDPIFAKDSINNWSCKACKAFPHVTATTFHGKKSDANGFLAYDADANEILVVFAGTDPLSIQNWIDDLNFIQTDYPYCSGCKVHQGFYNSFLSVYDQITPLLTSALSQHPSAKLSVTGHSLGAAMAAHCTAELAHHGYNVSASYTYGMPRVGNTAYETWYKTTGSSHIKGTYRVVHGHDPVPHVPFENMGGGFHHMPYEVFYERDGDKYTVCSEEGEDKNCSDKYITDLNVANHLNYLDFDFTTNYLSCQV